MVRPEYLKLGSCDLILVNDLLREVLVGIGHCGKAPADVIDWERHLIMGL